MANPLDHQLSQLPCPAQTRSALVNALWDVSRSSKQYDSIVDSLDRYFQYYEGQCYHSETSLATHRELVQVINCLKDGNSTRNDILRRLHQTSAPTRERTDASIALAARLWLMVNVGSTGQALIPSHSHFQWKDETMSDLIDTVFPQRHALQDHVKLEKIFNVRNLEDIAGIKVSWTDNLADHLLMKDDDTRVVLFTHAAFLERHRESTSQVFPTDFVEETLRTMSLLIPPNDKRVAAWFDKKHKQLGLDPRTRRCGHLKSSKRQIENFKYWRDRLVVLKQVFDESEPKSVRQWWHDDRKKVQWYTFWIAILVLILTLVFGFAQSVAGIVQAWASVKGLNSPRVFR